MNEKEINRILRLVDLYKIKHLKLDFKKLLSFDKWYIGTQLEIAKRYINIEIEKRITKAQKLAKKHLKEKPKKIYLQYYNKKYNWVVK